LLSFLNGFFCLTHHCGSASHSFLFPPPFLFFFSTLSFFDNRGLFTRAPLLKTNRPSLDFPRFFQRPHTLPHQDCPAFVDKEKVLVPQEDRMPLPMKRNRDFSRPITFQVCIFLLFPLRLFFSHFRQKNSLIRLCQLRRSK